MDYAHDAVGNILTWQQQADATAVLWEYGYDTADQLVAAVKKSTDPTPAVLKRYAYAFDPAGNRTVEQIDDVVTGATFNSMNELVSQQAAGALRFEGTVNEPAAVTIGGKPAVVTSNNRFGGSVPIATGTNTVVVTATDPSGNSATKTYQVDSGGSPKTFTYDANGNLTADAIRTFEWDARNQLVAVNVGTHRSEFTYNGFRRRVRIVEQENAVTQSDTKVLWCENDVCEELAADGTTVMRRAFVHAELVAGAAQFFALDHVGSVTDVTDGTSTIVGRYAFDPWGRRILSAGTDVSTVGYTGHRWLQASLSLTLNRVYDADVGRWLSEDPIGVSDGPNLYTYVSNRVTVWIDPLGLQSSCCDQLQARRRRLHQILDQIDAGIQPTGIIGGATTCAGSTPSPMDTDFIRKSMGPCLAECAIAHENRHERQCRRYGAEFMAKSNKLVERPAYLIELGCIIRQIRSAA